MLASWWWFWYNTAVQVSGSSSVLVWLVAIRSRWLPRKAGIIMCDFVKAEKLAKLSGFENLCKLVTGSNNVSDQAWQWLLSYIWGQETFSPSEGSLRTAWSFGEIEERTELLSGITGDWSRAGEMGLTEFSNLVYARLLIENPRLAINSKYGVELVTMDPSDPRVCMTPACWASYVELWQGEDLAEIMASNYNIKLAEYTPEIMFNVNNGFLYHLSLAQYLCMDEEPEEQVLNWGLLQTHGIVLTPAEYLVLMAQYESWVLRVL